MAETRAGTLTSVLLIGAAFFLTGLLAACGGTPAPAPASSRSAGSTTRSAAPSTTPSERSIPSVTASAAPPPVPAPSPPSPAAAAAPDCTQQVIQDAVNVGRDPDAQLTVSATDFHCQDDWAVAGGTDTVNKAQYSFVLRWADGRWQKVPDRSQACAGSQIPAVLLALACNSN